MDDLILLRQGTKVLIIARMFMFVESIRSTRNHQRMGIHRRESFRSKLGLDLLPCHSDNIARMSRFGIPLMSTITITTRIILIWTDDALTAIGFVVAVVAVVAVIGGCGRIAYVCCRYAIQHP
jgi:hypothetical protein